MEKEKLTSGQFVERWLPEYEMRLQEWRYGHSHAVRLNLTAGAFNRDNFPEALAAFEAHIRQETWREACEAMRERCAIECQAEADRVEIGETPRPIYGVLMCTPIPEIPKNDEK